MGGRNQNTQLFLSGWEDDEFVCFVSGTAVIEFFAPGLPDKEDSFNPFSVVGVFDPPPTTLPKSKAFPGDFGVLIEPNDAKAPDPKPNALDAPAVGEGMAVVEGEIALNGFVFPWDELSPPNLFPGV